MRIGMESLPSRIVASQYTIAVYKKADVNQKREIIGSIYPEKPVFSENNYRTARINEAAALILLSLIPHLPH